VALRPGKPTWFARCEDALVLGLPGNPASAFVCARLFLRPLLDRLLGRDPAAASATRRMRVAEPLSANGPRETYLRARAGGDEQGEMWVTRASDQDSSLISVLAAANALIVRTPGAPAPDAGDLVNVLDL
jgi:molybdopterin molybdotransferase